MFLLFLELTLQYPQEGRHLHSNMFLLFRSRLSPYQHNPFLFTFQYVSIISHLDYKQQIMRPEFTFQYVSIISASLRFNKLTVKKFTFQYVSIISGTAPQGEQTYVIFTFQYVSIISKPCKRRKTRQGKFTFQYVSIISACRRSFSLRIGFIYIPICFYYFHQDAGLRQQ